MEARSTAHPYPEPTSDQVENCNVGHVLDLKHMAHSPHRISIQSQAVLALSSSYLTHLHQEQTVANLDYKKGISA